MKIAILVIGIVLGISPVYEVKADATSPHVAFLGIRSAATDADVVRAFLSGLAETGFIEGRNVRIDYRWADGDAERLPSLAQGLIQSRPDVIVTAGNGAARAAKAATTTLPIVFSIGADPARSGLVTTLNHPGGNATGVTTFASELGAKHVQLLREIVPEARVLALLINSTAPDSQMQSASVERAVKATGQKLIVVDAKNESQLDAAFATAKQRAAALIVSSNGLFNARLKDIVALAVRYSIPTMYTRREFPVAGGLVSYGANFVEMYRYVGIYTGKILKGATPAELPVMQPTKFDLILNLNTAKALGVRIPKDLLIRADEVIQ